MGNLCICWTSPPLCPRSIGLSLVEVEKADSWKNCPLLLQVSNFVSQVPWLPLQYLFFVLRLISSKISINSSFSKNTNSQAVISLNWFTKFLWLVFNLFCNFEYYIKFIFKCAMKLLLLTTVITNHDTWTSNDSVFLIFLFYIKLVLQKKKQEMGCFPFKKLSILEFFLSLLQICQTRKIMNMSKEKRTNSQIFL